MGHRGKGPLQNFMAFTGVLFVIARGGGSTQATRHQFQLAGAEGAQQVGPVAHVFGLFLNPEAGLGLAVAAQHLLQLLQRTAGETALGKGLSVAEGVLIAALVIYVPIYLYRAMRRVYGQGPIVTSAKYAVLGIAYVVCLSLTAVGLLVYTALTL